MIILRILFTCAVNQNPPPRGEVGFRGWAGSFSLERSKLLSSAAFDAEEVGFMRKRAKRVD